MFDKKEDEKSRDAMTPTYEEGTQMAEDDVMEGQEGGAPQFEETLRFASGLARAAFHRSRDSARVHIHEVRVTFL